VIGPADSNAAFGLVALLSNGADRIRDMLYKLFRAMVREGDAARWQCGTQLMGGTTTADQYRVLVEICAVLPDSSPVASAMGGINFVHCASTSSFKEQYTHCDGGGIGRRYGITGGTEGPRMRLSGGVLRAAEAFRRVAPGITALYSEHRQRHDNHVETTIFGRRQTANNDGDTTSIGGSNDCSSIYAT
jgi:hypothetical protein